MNDSRMTVDFGELTLIEKSHEMYEEVRAFAKEAPLQGRIKLIGATCFEILAVIYSTVGTIGKLLSDTVSHAQSDRGIVKNTKQALWDIAGVLVYIVVYMPATFVFVAIESLFKILWILCDPTSTRSVVRIVEDSCYTDRFKDTLVEVWAETFHVTAGMTLSDRLLMIESPDLSTEMAPSGELQIESSDLSVTKLVFPSPLTRLRRLHQQRDLAESGGLLKIESPDLPAEEMGFPPLLTKSRRLNQKGDLADFPLSNLYNQQNKAQITNNGYQTFT